jgi:L-aspartate oxidase
VAGEVAMTGMHGANRLASNSLLEAVVVSKYAAHRTVKLFKELDLPENLRFDIEPSLETGIRGGFEVQKERQKLTKMMSDKVGIVRSEKRLKEASKVIAEIKEVIEDAFIVSSPQYELVELRNLATAAELITQSALWRKESRGLHFMEDYPEISPAFAKDSNFRISITKGKTVV